jgi:hypothetical protein
VTASVVPIDPPPPAQPSVGNAPGAEAGGLEEIDQVLKSWSDQRHAFAARQVEIEATRQLFVRQAAEIADHVIRPAMQAALTRLAHDGGGGRIEERRGDDTHSLRLILWMSLEGDVAERPRQDRNPYLQLDIDVATRRVDVWEGDMWEKQGSSRSTTPWQLSEITAQSVTQRVIDILRRAAGHDVEA